MSDETEREAAMERAERLIPELAARLALHGLGEIEVRDDGLRLRVTAGPSDAPSIEPRRVADPLERSAEAPSAAAGTEPIASPGVGYFLYAEGLGPGLVVQDGDVIGHVEVLGVRHDVRAPRDGTIRNLVAETGEAVEFGQTLVELEASPP